MKRILVSFAAAVTFAVCSVPAQATSVVLYNNLGGSIVGRDPLVSFGPLADSFSTGGTAVNLSDVKVNLWTGAIVDPLATISLLGDNSTSPGALISTLGTVDVSGSTPTVYDLGGLSVSLAASTRYWIEVTTSDTNMEWPWTTATGGTGVAGEFFSNANGVFPNSGGPYLMEVSAMVPEPPVLPIFALGCLAMVFLGRRRLRFTR